MNKYICVSKKLRTNIYLEKIYQQGNINIILASGSTLKRQTETKNNYMYIDKIQLKYTPHLVKQATDFS